MDGVCRTWLHGMARSFGVLRDMNYKIVISRSPNDLRNIIKELSQNANHFEIVHKSTS